jgi:copper chaperone CopZ
MVALFCAALCGCAEPRTAEVRLSIEGMVCESCSEAITHALSKIEGVEAVTVNHETGATAIRIRDGAVETAALVGAVEDLGYHAVPVLQVTPPA